MAIESVSAAQATALAAQNVRVNGGTDATSIGNAEANIGGAAVNGKAALEMLAMLQKTGLARGLNILS